MKRPFFIITFIVGIFSCSSHQETVAILPANVSEGTISPDASATITFEDDVMPVLKMHCNPCHFPGGKLYEKLPFDRATTIISHAPGILKRIQDETEAATIRKFVEASGNASN